MADTWGDLKTQVFYKLDLPSSTTGDVASAVEQALFDTLEDISNALSLPSLLTEPSAVNLVNPAETLELNSDFSVTDLSEIFIVRVNTNPTDSSSLYEKWEEISYEAYLKMVSTKGDKRSSYSWALGPDRDTLYFTTAPASGETWSVKVVYYKTLAAYNNANEPEIPGQHRKLLVNGAAASFPQYFQGDRAPLFEKTTALYTNGIKRLQAELRSRSAFKRLRSRVGRSTRTRVTWE